MTFLPIVARELRVAARRRGTYWSRTLMAVAAIGVGMFTFMESSGEPPHRIGQELFQVLSILAFIYCYCAGVRSTADCLSEEKRDGTLGLLFLTDLKGYDVVGGKLVATSLNAFYGLCAILPVMAIPLLMGGVTNGEFWRMSLVLVNTFLLSLSVGMFVSSISKYPRKSMAVTTILLLMISVGLPVLQAWLSMAYRTPRFDFFLTAITPDTAFSLVYDLDYAKASNTFWWSVGVTHGLCWLLLAFASFVVPRSWQDNPPGARAQRWRDLWHRWSFGDPGERAAFRKHLLDANAFFWLAGRVRLKPAHVWAALVAVACLWSWGAVENGSEWTNGLCYFVTALVLNSMLKIWITSEAGKQFGEDRRMGSLELILSTPFSVADILRGQILALKRQFLGPLIVVLMVEIVFLLAVLQGNRDPEAFAAYVAFGLTMMLMLVADVLALGAVAMWTGLTAKNPNRATGMVLRRILVLPWIVTGVVMFIAGLITAVAQGQVTWQLFLGVYVVTGLFADLYFGLNAWRRLQTEFREVAVQRFSAAPASFWSRLFRSRSQTEPVAPPVVAS